MKILKATYSPSIQTGPDDVHGHDGGLIVNLPAAITIGDRVGVRSQPDNPNGYPFVLVLPDGADTINGAANFFITDWGSCFTFVVGEVGDWWVESAYVSPVVE